MVNISSLDAELKQVAAQIEQQLPAAPQAALLRQLASDLRSAPQRWLSVDLTRVINLAEIGATLREAHLQPARALARRGFTILGGSVLVLLAFDGIALTLTAATSVYLPASNAPFITLWQQGLNGHLSGIFTPATLLLLNTFFGVLAGSAAIWLLRQRTRAEQQAAQASRSIIGPLQSLLIKVQIALADAFRLENASMEKRSLALLESLNNFVSRFEAHSAELENIIARDQQRLAELAQSQQKEVELLHTVHGDLSVFAQGVAQTGPAFIQALKEFQNASDTFSTETVRLQQIQSRQMDNTTQFQRQISSLEEEIGRLNQVQKKITTDLLKASTQNVVKSDELSGHINALEKVLRRMSESQLNLQNLMEDQMRASDGWLKSLQESARALTPSEDSETP